jgi:DNA polymerase
MSDLDELDQRIASCPDCDLCRTRIKSVPGEGPADAELLFVGEAPGFYEDQQARPFVGAAGRFLEQLLASIGLRRDQVFITNVVKCRPPNNRDPLPGEIDACRKYLQRQIELIRPKGQAKVREGICFIPMYHPAAALHAGNMRKVIEDDFRRIPAILERARQAPQPQAAPEPEPEQMRLF